ncbi:DUF1839 family protein [Wenjunlia tyrosinilytica]|uniref:Uncharacterized protein n=1 Tax=Wenjunlia tyrosinilytica TaxID=1544741 RepID=A0A918DVA7_9ACTN|nr:hypothetical protein GCM10012280_17400 [Wenjunlia tyrosinilytica]
MAARFARWLAHAGAVDRFDEAADSLDAVSQSAKRLILKAARAVATGRPLTADATFAGMSAAWHRAGRQLAQAL